jgi:hypothetical protein
MHELSYMFQRYIIIILRETIQNYMKQTNPVYLYSVKNN